MLVKIDGSALRALPLPLVATLVGVELTVAVRANHSQVSSTMIESVATYMIENEDQLLAIPLLSTSTHVAQSRLVGKDVDPHPVSLAGVIRSLASG